MVEIKARKIEEWAKTKKTCAREELPVLVRFLIHSTGGKFTHFDFPAFDNGQRPGWDGELKTETPTSWIPNGWSGWEFSCDKNPKGKATADYEKRTKEIPSEERLSMTFIFVTPHNWQSKKQWVTEKRNQGDWKDVRVYDASDLEQWLEQSIGTRVWFAERLGCPISGYQSPDKCWSDWANACQPAISPKLFPATEKSTCLRQWLDLPPERPFIVAGGGSPDEALAFACLLMLEEESINNPFPNAIVIDSPEVMRRFRVSNSIPPQFIVIVHTSNVEKEIGNLYKHCHCLIVRPDNDLENEPDIKLGLADWYDFSNALKDMGLSKGKIDKLMRETGRSPTVLRRRLSKIPEIRVHSWANDSNTVQELLPTVLVGTWCKKSQGDKEIVKRLAGVNHDRDIERDINKLLDLPDSPLWTSSEFQGVVSHFDAMLGIAKFLTDSDLGTFFCVAEDVLSESDPALELSEGEKGSAESYSKIHRHSAKLREGIRETLIIFSVHGDTLFNKQCGYVLKSRTSCLIRRLLDPLTIDKLLSHQDDLADYAEVAPDVLLELIEDDLQKSKPAVIDLLRFVESNLFSSKCPRAGLLWALESLAWNHIERVSKILTQLSTVAINDNWENKPIHSLEALYSSNSPQTTASLSERIQNLEILTKQFPDVVWHICVTVLNTDSRKAFSNHRPRWRTPNTRECVTSEQMNEFRLKVLRLILEWPNHNHQTLGDLVELLHNLSEKNQMEVWDLIDNWETAETNNKFRANLHERIRQSMSTWCLHPCKVQSESLERAHTVYNRLKPSDPVVCHSWLFSDSWTGPVIGETMDEYHNYKKHSEKIRKLRVSATKEIWANQGFEGVIAILTICGTPYMVGQSMEVSIYDDSVRVNFVKQCLSFTSDSLFLEKINRCLKGFLSSIDDDVRNSLLMEVASDLNARQIVRLYCCAPFRWNTWRLLDMYGSKIKEQYWQEVKPENICYGEAELVEIVDRLLDAIRPLEALFASVMNFPKIETSRLKRILFDLSNLGASDTNLRNHYMNSTYYYISISRALNELNDRSDIHQDEMALLELMYFQQIRRKEYGYGIPNLEWRISESPMNFVRILAIGFEREDGKKDPQEWSITDARKQTTLRCTAYEILDLVSRIPGTRNESDIDGDKLSRWIKEARRLCAKYGRESFGDIYIGGILARGPTDEEGDWPCIAVCEAMEKIRSQNIKSGFIASIVNTHGVTVRPFGEGGVQERELVKKYRSWAQKRKIKYPYVASVLQSIADSYDYDALKRDDEAENERQRIRY